MIRIGELPKQLSVSPESAGVPVSRLDDQLGDRLDVELPAPRHPDSTERDPYALSPIPELYLG